MTHMDSSEQVRSVGACQQLSAVLVVAPVGLDTIRQTALVHAAAGRRRDLDVAPAALKRLVDNCRVAAEHASLDLDGKLRDEIGAGALVFLPVGALHDRDD